MFSPLGLASRLALVVVLLSTAAPLVVRAPAEAQSIAGDARVARYADALGTANARLPLAARRDLAERVLLLSSYYKLDPCLLGALVSVESAWRARAVSPAGALGYGQLMPGTASALRVDPLEPYENLDGTARYLRRMLNRFAGRDQLTRMQLALASYNAGAGAVERYHGIPPYRETRAYVANVLRTRHSFVASIASPASPAPVAQVARVMPVPHRVRLVSRDAPAVEQRLVFAPPAVRYERSRSFVARLLGLRHRVTTSGYGGVP